MERWLLIWVQERLVRPQAPSKELFEDFTMKMRERRSKRRAQFRTQLHGGSMELEFTEGSASSISVAETGEAMNDP